MVLPQDGAPRLALPATLVTEENREEITSRVPRRVPGRKTRCLKCSLDKALDAMKDYKVYRNTGYTLQDGYNFLIVNLQGSVKPGILIVITGEQPRSIVLGSVLDKVRQNNIQVFLLSSVSV